MRNAHFHADLMYQLYIHTHIYVAADVKVSHDLSLLVKAKNQNSILNKARAYTISSGAKGYCF